MSALAKLMVTRGFKVSGSDLTESQMVNDLKKRGIKVTIGHDQKNIQDATTVIYSSAIRENNPEMISARSRQIPILQRAELLASLMEDKKGITIAGAHGKTTTASMITHLMIKAGMKPTTAIGGIVNGNSYNAQSGEGQYFVAEVDESDGSFLNFSPDYSIITNIDFEHLDYYKSFSNLYEAFRKFIQQTSRQGTIIYCGEDTLLRELTKDVPCECVMYGIYDQHEVVAKKIQFDGFHSKFQCMIEGQNKGEIELNVPGEHNIYNALACVSLGWKLKIDFKIIQESFLEYQGVQRRFQLKGEVNDILVIDDYGHHPTEIKMTIATAQQLNRKRVITVFQPHRYTRTQYLFDEFIDVLMMCDYLIITDIYAANENPIEGISGQNMYEEIRKRRKDETFYLKKEEILDHLNSEVKSGDVVLTLGAGDIYHIGDDLIKKLERGHPEVDS